MRTSLGEPGTMARSASKLDLRWSRRRRSSTLWWARLPGWAPGSTCPWVDPLSESSDPLHSQAGVGRGRRRSDRRRLLRRTGAVLVGLWRIGDGEAGVEKQRRSRRCRNGGVCMLDDTDGLCHNTKRSLELSQPESYQCKKYMHSINL